MYIITSFEHSKEIEIALEQLKNLGLSKNEILILPLDKKPANIKFIDSINHTDRESLIDIPAILGMNLMLLGSIYGFVLKWGPIIWAIIGLISGILIGAITKYIYIKKKNKRSKNKRNSKTEIIMIISCKNFQEEVVKSVLWKNNSLGLATLHQEM